MKEFPSKTTSPHGPAPSDQGRQTVRWANGNGFFASWRRKCTEGSGRDPHVAESIGVEQLGRDSDVARRNEVKTSLPRTLRALVSSMSFRKIRELKIPSAPTSLLSPAPIDTASESPQPELAISPASATTSTSPLPDVDRASINSMSQPLNDTYQEPAPATATASAPSSPSIHPTFAAFLDESALEETARALTAENDSVSANLSWRSSGYYSTTASPTFSRLGIPLWPEADCDHHACLLAAQRIKVLRLWERASAMDHRTRQVLDRAVIACYQVLRDCEHRRTIALVGDVVAEVQRIGSPYAHGLFGTVYTLLQFSGIHPSMVPALAGAGAIQRQDVHAGAVGYLHWHMYVGEYVPAGGYMYAGGFVPAGGNTAGLGMNVQ